MSAHTPTATDYFILRLGEEPKTASEKLTVVMMTEYTESLRAERDGLVEALRDAWSALKEADRRFSIKTGNALSESITQTLAKYEK